MHLKSMRAKCGCAIRITHEKAVGLRVHAGIRIHCARVCGGGAGHRIAKPTRGGNRTRIGSVLFLPMQHPRHAEIDDQRRDSKEDDHGCSGDQHHLSAFTSHC
jgi:hypothetical protein